MARGDVYRWTTVIWIYCSAPFVSVFFFQRHCFMLTASWHLSAVECKIWILGYQMKKKSDSNKINEEINPLLWLLSIDIIRGNNDLGHDLSHIIICLFHVLLL